MSLKILLKAVSSYMSREHFEGELDAWLVRPVVPAVPAAGEEPELPGGGLQVERDELVAETPNCEGSTAGAMIARCKEMLLALEYVDTKFLLGEEFVRGYRNYEDLIGEITGLDNKVLRNEKKKSRSSGGDGFRL